MLIDALLLSAMALPLEVAMQEEKMHDCRESVSMEYMQPPVLAEHDMKVHDCRDRNDLE